MVRIQTNKAIRSGLPQGTTGATPICAHVSLSACLTNSAVGNSIILPKEPYALLCEATHSNKPQLTQQKTVPRIMEFEIT